MNNLYRTSMGTIADILLLEKKWTTLEGCSENSFFLSWYWINNWLNTYCPNAEVLQVTFNGEVVGLAIFTRVVETRYRVLNSRKVLLHQTGIASQDQIWIEYNDVLATKEHYYNVCKQVLQHLKNESLIDEIEVSGVLESKAKLFTSVSELTITTQWEAPTYAVDLEGVRNSGNSFLSTLSRNTRYQINRSKKLFAKQGQLTLTLANSKKQALDYFHNISPLHIKRWGKTFGGSGFNNQDFINFHLNLIERCWDKGIIHLWRMQLDETDVGYFYNFIYQNKVYFYLCGLESYNNSKLKPGMQGHAYCIQYYLEHGYQTYDFMGGDARYKSSLATKNETLCKIKLQQPKIKFWLENQARKLKSSYLAPHE